MSNEIKPDRYLCRACGRDTLSKPYEPHKCCSGTTTKNFRKIAKVKNIEGPLFVKLNPKEL